MMTYKINNKHLNKFNKLLKVYANFSTTNLYYNRIEYEYNYTNLLIDKNKILKDNKDKSGVYRFINKKNNKSYVGSSNNLYYRLLNYFSPKFLEKKIIINNSCIYRALLKYGYENFTLQILSYCSKDDKSNLLKLEQYFIDSIKPEYNILKIAGSNLGFKHSPETLFKFKSRKLSSEAINNLKLAKKGKAPTSSLRALNHLLAVSYKITITNVITNQIKNYDSLKTAALDLKVSHQTLSKYLKNKLLLKGTYLIQRKL